MKRIAMFGCLALLACGGAAAMTAATCPAPKTVTVTDTVVQVDTVAGDTVYQTDTLTVTDTAVVTDTVVTVDSVNVPLAIDLTGQWKFGAKATTDGSASLAWPIRAGTASLTQTGNTITGTVHMLTSPDSIADYAVSGSVDTSTRAVTIKFGPCIVSDFVSNDGVSMYGTYVCAVDGGWWSWTR